MRRGYTLAEVAVVVTIMAVLVAAPAPRFGRSLEQPKLDMAAATLRAIWAAERFYYLENGRYGSLSDIAADPLAADLIDPSVLSGSTFYAFSVVPAGDGQSFLATAVRPTTVPCSGPLTIDQTGALSSSVFYLGQTMTPSLEPLP
jgi:prepilin-type N-terminal cleavage/methylation domain-containing protein